MPPVAHTGEQVVFERMRRICAAIVEQMLGRQPQVHVALIDAEPRVLEAGDPCNVRASRPRLVQYFHLPARRPRARRTGIAEIARPCLIATRPAPSSAAPSSRTSPSLPVSLPADGPSAGALVSPRPLECVAIEVAFAKTGAGHTAHPGNSQAVRHREHAGGLRTGRPRTGKTARQRFEQNPQGRVRAHQRACDDDDGLDAGARNRDVPTAPECRHRMNPAQRHDCHSQRPQAVTANSRLVSGDDRGVPKRVREVMASDANQLEESLDEPRVRLPWRQRANLEPGPTRRRRAAASTRHGRGRPTDP